MDHEPITIETVRRLEVQAGDVVVVTLAELVTLERAAWIRDQVKDALPGVKVLVLAAGVELAVYTPAEISELVA